MTKLAIHPAAEIFPLIEGEELKALAESIKQHGQQLPILLYQGKVIDGRNRCRACQMAKVEPWTATADLDGMTPLEFVLTLNDKRRHMTREERSFSAAKAKVVFEAEAKERQKAAGKEHGRGKPESGKNPEEKKVPVPGPEPIKGDARDKAGEAFGVSGKSVDRAEKVLEKGTPELVAAATKGEIPLTKAAKIAGQPKAEQAKAIEQAKNKPAPKPEGSIVKDAIDRDVPEHLREKQATAVVIQAAATKLDAARRAVEELADQPGAEFLPVSEVCELIKQVKGKISQSRYWSECPRCKGKPAPQCDRCSGHGFIPFARRGSLSAEDRAWLGVAT